MTQYSLPADTDGFSLVRFSTIGQADGDSFRRQDSAAAAFCRDEGIVLDRSLHEADIRKLGMSALSGKHLAKGPIRKFLKGIEDGKVRRGSLLLVGEWNRLTRQISSDAIKFVIDLMERGIGIVDLQDRTLYTLARYNADVGLQLGLQIKISMAHQYSANLRHNLNAYWSGRRDAVHEGRAKATNQCPEWLRAIDGKFEPIPERVAVIERIKADRYLGLGKNAIATRLNTIHPVPAFRGKDGWHASAVERLVKNPALYGVYQPRDVNGEAVGEPAMFYPEIMTADEWFRMQWPVDARRAASGRHTGGVLNNLFAELIQCHCGAGLVRENKGSSGAFLVCSKARRGLCHDRTRHPLATLESEILTALSLFDVSRFVGSANPAATKIAALEAEIAEKSVTLEKMAEGFGDNVPAAFFQRAQRLQGEVDAAKAALADARIASRIAEANTTKDSHAAFRAMVEKLPTMAGEAQFQTRQRIAGELGRLIRHGAAAGDKITLALATTDWAKVEIELQRSAIVGVRIITERVNVLFGREALFRDGGLDLPAGIFAGAVA